MMENPNRNPNPNDERVRNLRKVIIVQICWKFLGVAGLLFLSHKMSAGASAAREESGRESTWREGLKIRIEALEFVAAGLNWSALPLVILYCVALFGVVKEKLSLIQFYWIWLILENVVAVLIIYLFHIKLGAPFGAVFPFAIWFGYNLFCIAGATQFVKLVQLRGSRSSSLGSSPTVVYSA